MQKVLAETLARCVSWVLVNVCEFTAEAQSTQRYHNLNNSRQTQQQQNVVIRLLSFKSLSMTFRLPRE